MATKKKTAKKAPAKKATAKKAVAKKQPVKKKPAKKQAAKKSAKVAAKKPAKAKKPVKAKKLSAKKTKPAKKPIPVKKPEKKPVKNRVPPRIVHKVPTAILMTQGNEVFKPVDTEKAVAFAMSIAEKMKSSAADEAKRIAKAEEEETIRLSRRPTTRTKGKNSVQFAKADLKDFRKRLLDARAKALSGADRMRAVGFNESEDHEADGGDGTNQTLRLQALGQVGSINRTIQQIDEALHRIDDGSYGVCTICGQLIRKPRLINQPFVLTCMECQSEVERAAK